MRKGKKQEREDRARGRRWSQSNGRLGLLTWEIQELINEPLEGTRREREREGGRLKI